MKQKMHTFPRGIFTISIDHEFGWGRPENPFLEEEEKIVREEVSLVRRLLSLFEEFKVSTTWAIVSHLLETSCSWLGSVPHSDYPRPVSYKGNTDWFFQHPAPSDIKDVLWFDSEHLISSISSSVVKHEIASHSYAHIAYGSYNTNPDAVKFDIQKDQSIHKALGFPFESFVFPWNKEGFHELLKESGIKCYRGNTVHWYSFLPNILKRVTHFLDYFLPTAPPVVVPSVHSSGLLNIPGSMLFMSRSGIRKIMPAGILKRKMIKGLHRAVAEKRIFHLWFHPSNFSYESEKQFAILREVLQEAEKLRNQGKLDILTMSQIANTLNV